MSRVLSTRLTFGLITIPKDRRRIFSPPPPPQNNAIPPVPLLPRNLRGQQSLPMRRHPPPHPHPSGIVRPNAQPFDFEANIRMATAQSARAVPQPLLAAAPPSHHVPAMGLGGALLAMRGSHPVPHAPENNNNTHHGARLQRLPRSRNLWVGSFLDLFYRDREADDANQDDVYPSDEDEAFFALLSADADDHHHGGPPFLISDNGRRLRHFEPEYKPIYTHPGKPAPGFTFDFAPPTEESPTSKPESSVIVVDDSPGPSTRSAVSSSSHRDDSNTILVCARCTDPLVTSDSATGEEHARKRTWALRCGHMLDGKCVEEIMKPPAGESPKVMGTTDKEEEQDLLRSSKGKGRAVDSAPFTESDEPLQRFPAPDPNPIRARLRPRPGAGITIGPQPYPSPARSIRPLPIRVGKGKGRAKGPIVEAEHTWRCPVTGCAKVHTSLLIEGKWVMDEKTGAIGVYV